MAYPAGTWLLLGVDGFVLSRLWNTSAFWTILTALVIGAAVLYAIVLLYAFPLLARFENTTLGILRTSFAVGVRYLFCTLLMAFIYAVMGWITVAFSRPPFFWEWACVPCYVLSSW